MPKKTRLFEIQDIFKDNKNVLKDYKLVSRTELRILERRGFVEKTPIFGKRKYSNVNPPKRFIWEWRTIEVL